jgi:hypothetical protein
LLQENVNSPVIRHRSSIGDPSVIHPSTVISVIGHPSAVNAPPASLAGTNFSFGWNTLGKIGPFACTQ